MSVYTQKEEEKEVEEEELIKEHLLAKSEISLIVKNYNDIFSSFDPRPFSERALSDDFLQEAKRAARDKRGIYELRFLIPRDQRNFEHEVLIKRRLKEHFKKHFRAIYGEISQTRKKGFIMAFFGVLFIFGATFLASFGNHNLILTFLEVLLEPAGWFTAWTGLEQAFFSVDLKKEDLDFYRKLSEAEVRFSSY